MTAFAQLAACDRALRREAHVLARRPDLTWQQLHNRLRDEDAAAATVAAQRPARAGRMWLAARAGLESPELVRTLLTDAAGPAKACAISPDGTLLVAACGQRLLVWDAAGGVPLASLEGHTRDVWGCAVGPDSSWIASAAQDGTVGVWDARTGAALWRVAGHPGTALGCAVSPDGTLLASAGQGGARLWDAAGGGEVASLDLESGSGAIRAVAFMADGRSVLVGLGTSPAVWDPATGEAPRVAPGDDDAHEWPIDACAVSPDGTWAASTSGRELRIWDLPAGRCRHAVTSPGESLESCTVAPDGSFVLCACRDGTLRTWDPDSGEPLAVLYGHEDWVQDAVVSPDGAWVASAGRDATVRVWRTPGPEAAGRGRPAQEGAIPGGVVSRDAGWVVCSAREPVALGDRVGEPGTALTGIGDCAVVPGGARAVSAGAGAYVVWEPVTGERVRSVIVSSTSAGAGACAVSPDGTWLLAASAERLKAFDLRSFSDCGLYKAGSDPMSGYSMSHSGAGISDCCIGPDARWVVSADAGGTLRIWDADDGAWPDDAPAGMRGHTCAASPDGSFIVAGRSDGGLSVGELGGTAQPRELAGHTAAVLDCAVTPDAAFVLSAGADRALRVWDRDGREVAALFLPARIDAIAVHPSRPWVACSTFLGLVVVELVGVEYGPLAVTAQGPERAVRCPACSVLQPVREDELGAVRACVSPGCSALLRIAAAPMRDGPPQRLFSDADEEIRREYYDTL